MIASHAKPDSAGRSDLTIWLRELCLAVPIVALVMYLFYTWFAVSNRYTMFLYFHEIDPEFDTSPFGWMTIGRYWMTGLVAGGAVLVPYLAANLVLGRVVRRYRAPVWWRVWTLCAIPLLIIIPAIVMTVNDPVLPLRHAARVTATLLIALALAVYLGEYAAARPLGFVLLLIDAVALALLVMGLRAMPGLPGALHRGKTTAVALYLAVLAVGALLLLGMSAIYGVWRQVTIPDAMTLLVAGVNFHYLVLPLYHHLFWCTDVGSWTDPGYFNYIPAAGNYFLYNILLQVFVWVEWVLIVVGVTRLRQWFRQRRGVIPR